MTTLRPTLRQQFDLAWSMLDVRYGAFGMAAGAIGQLLWSSAFWVITPKGSTPLLAITGTLYSLVSVVFHGLIGSYVFFLVVVLMPRLYRHYKNVETASDDVETLRLNARYFREDTGTVVVEGADPLLDAYKMDHLYDRELPLRTAFHVQSTKADFKRPVHEAIRELAMIAQQKCAAIKTVMGPDNMDLLKALNEVEYSAFRVLHTGRGDISYPRLIQHIERMVRAFDRTAAP